MRSDPTSAVVPAVRSQGCCEPAAPGARPLYLMTSGQCVVDLDGPALAVRRKDRSGALFPLQRVSRIVSAASVEWKPRAMSGCLERGIPIVLMGGNGAPVGYVQPINSAGSSLDRLLCELMERPDWRRHYENWLRAERMRAVRSWIANRRDSGCVVEEARQKEAIRRCVYASAWRDGIAAQPAIYRGALMALACERVRTAGLAATYSGNQGTDLHLAVELCNLLCLALDLEIGDLGEAADAETRASLRIVETYTAGLEQRCGSILGRLHRRASELLREWR